LQQCEGLEPGVKGLVQYTGPQNFRFFFSFGLTFNNADTASSNFNGWSESLPAYFRFGLVSIV
jgi:hypothetical protein